MSLFKSSAVYASTSDTTVHPIADSFNSSALGWNEGGTPRWSRIDEVSLNTNDWIGEESFGTSIWNMRMGAPEYIGQGVTRATANIWCSMDGAFFDTDDSLKFSTMYGKTSQQASGIPMVPEADVTCTEGLNNYSKYSNSANGSWTMAQLSGVDFGFTRSIGAPTAQEQHIAMINMVYRYTNPPVWDQSTYRAYRSSSTTTPAAPLASENSQAMLTNPGDTFRVRLGIKNTGDTAWNTSFGTYKLQYAEKITTCNAASYADIQSGTGDIRWYNDAPSDGASISSLPNDPSGTNVYQNYRESNSFTNSTSVAVNAIALWDFSLKDYSSTPGTVYCLKLVKSDINNSYETFNYTRYPEIRVVGNLSVDIVDGGDNPIANPVLQFGLGYIASTCQDSTATMGGGTGILLSNQSSSSGWSVSVAATNGTNALWTSGGVDHYDYNDSSGCADGSDTDSSAGQLSVNPSAASITPSNGCTNSNISKGPQAAFSEGAISAITIMSASSGADMFCSWKMTDIGFKQKVPSYTPSGTYTLDLTVTSVAS